MRHYIIYKVLHECDAEHLDDAIQDMATTAGITYDVADHCIMNIPCDTQPSNWWMVIQEVDSERV